MPGANDLFGVCQPEGDEEQPRLVHMVVVLIHDDDLDIRGWVEPPQAVCAQGAPGTPPGMTIRLGMLPLSAPDPGPNALYYFRGRPPYSLALRETIAAKCGLAGTGRLLDVGCGPGVLGVELAPLVGEVVGLDPDVDMLAEAARHARQARVANVQWVEALAEQIPELDLGTFRLVTFGQSFHRTDRERVAEAVFDVLEPGGNIALVARTVEGRPEPAGPGLPKIPHEAIRSLVDKYLGPKPRSWTRVRRPRHGPMGGCPRPDSLRALPPDFRSRSARHSPRRRRRPRQLPVDVVCRPAPVRRPARPLRG